MLIGRARTRNSCAQLRSRAQMRRPPRGPGAPRLAINGAPNPRPCVSAPAAEPPFALICPPLPCPSALGDGDAARNHQRR